jgi:phosphatidylserine decarboxylase
MSEFDDETTKHLIHHFQKGGWMPISQDVLEKVDRWCPPRRSPEVTQEPFLPVIEDFKKFIEENGEMYMGFNRMFEGATQPVSST